MTKIDNRICPNQQNVLSMDHFRGSGPRAGQLKIGMPDQIPLSRVEVLVVKREPLLAEALLRSCRVAFPGRSWGLERSGQVALEVLRESPVDVLICGLNLEGLDGLDLLELARREGLARRRLVVTDRRDERVIQFLVAGGHDVSFVGNDAPGSEALDAALRQVAEGRRVCDLELRSEWLRLRKDPAAYGWVLTDAEQEVLAALAELGGDLEVAQLRGTSPATVQTQRKRIMQKLRLRTQAQLVTYAGCRGLVRFESGKVMRPGFQWQQWQSNTNDAGVVREAGLIWHTPNRGIWTG